MNMPGLTAEAAISSRGWFFNSTRPRASGWLHMANEGGIVPAAGPGSPCQWWEWPIFPGAGARLFSEMATEWDFDSRSRSMSPLQLFVSLALVDFSVYRRTSRRRIQ